MQEKLEKLELEGPTRGQLAITLPQHLTEASKMQSG